MWSAQVTMVTVQDRAYLDTSGVLSRIDFAYIIEHIQMLHLFNLNKHIYKFASMPHDNK